MMNNEAQMKEAEATAQEQKLLIEECTEAPSLESEAQSAENTVDASAALQDEEDSAIALMRRQLDELRAVVERGLKPIEETAKDISALSELFPNVRREDIPDAVWEEVRRGVPLLAAYALHEKRRERREQINRRNALLSSGPIENATDSNYYSPEEVKKMTPKEVRRHFARIRESMKRWN